MLLKHIISDHKDAIAVRSATKECSKMNRPPPPTPPPLLSFTKADEHHEFIKSVCICVRTQSGKTVSYMDWQHIVVGVRCCGMMMMAMIILSVALNWRIYFEIFTWASFNSNGYWWTKKKLLFCIFFLRFFDILFFLSTLLSVHSSTVLLHMKH